MSFSSRYRGDVERQIRQKMQTVATNLKKWEKRCDDANDKIPDAKRRIMAAYEKRRQLQQLVLQKEKEASRKEQELSFASVMLQNKTRFVDEVVRYTYGMADGKDELRKLEIKLAAAKQLYNDTFRKWSELRVRRDKLWEELQDREYRSDLAEREADTRLQTLRFRQNEEIRLSRENQTSQLRLRAVEEDAVEVNKKYQDVADRKQAALQVIQILNERMDEVEELTEKYRLDRLRMEKSIMMVLKNAKDFQNMNGHCEEGDEEKEE